MARAILYVMYLCIYAMRCARSGCRVLIHRLHTQSSVCCNEIECACCRARKIYARVHYSCFSPAWLSVRSLAVAEKK